MSPRASLDVRMLYNDRTTMRDCDVNPRMDHVDTRLSIHSAARAVHYARRRRLMIRGGAIRPQGTCQSVRLDRSTPLVVQASAGRRRRHRIRKHHNDGNASSLRNGAALAPEATSTRLCSQPSENQCPRLNAAMGCDHTSSFVSPSADASSSSIDICGLLGRVQRRSPRRARSSIRYCRCPSSSR